MLQSFCQGPRYPCPAPFAGPLDKRNAASGSEIGGAVLVIVLLVYKGREYISFLLQETQFYPEASLKMTAPCILPEFQLIKKASELARINHCRLLSRFSLIRLDFSWPTPSLACDLGVASDDYNSLLIQQMVGRCLHKIKLKYVE